MSAGDLALDDNHELASKLHLAFKKAVHDRTSQRTFDSKCAQRRPRPGKPSKRARARSAPPGGRRSNASGGDHPAPASLNPSALVEELLQDDRNVLARNELEQVKKALAWDKEKM